MKVRTYSYDYFNTDKENTIEVKTPMRNIKKFNSPSKLDPGLGLKITGNSLHSTSPKNKDVFLAPELFNKDLREALDLPKILESLNKHLNGIEVRQTKSKVEGNPENSDKKERNDDVKGATDRDGKLYTDKFNGKSFLSLIVCNDLEYKPLKEDLNYIKMRDQQEKVMFLKL